MKDKEPKKKKLFYFVIEEGRSAHVMSATSKKEMEQCLILMYNWHYAFDKESKAKKIGDTDSYISQQTKDFAEVEDETDGAEASDIVSAESMISTYMREAKVNNYKDLLKYSLTFNLDE